MALAPCLFWICQLFGDKKYTAYDRFHGNSPYGEIPTKKEPIRTLGFALPYNKTFYYMASSMSGLDLLRCDWLPERARCRSYLAPSGLPDAKSHIINPLLTKLDWSRWLDILLVLTVFANLWISTPSRYINTQKRTRPPWRHTWSMTNIFFFQWNSSEFKWTFADILTSHCTLSPCLEETKWVQLQRRRSAPMTDDKLYTSLSANTIIAKLTKHV